MCESSTRSTDCISVNRVRDLHILTTIVRISTSRAAVMLTQVEILNSGLYCHCTLLIWRQTGFLGCSRSRIRCTHVIFVMVIRTSYAIEIRTSYVIKIRTHCVISIRTSYDIEIRASYFIGILTSYCIEICTSDVI